MIHLLSEQLLNQYLDRQKIDIFLSEAERANRSFNLFSRNSNRRDLEIMAAESLIPVYAGWIDNKSDFVLDIGSGWGIPAIPIMLTGLNTKFTLLERSQKKADFLLLLMHKLGLQAEVISEDLSRFNTDREYSSILIRGVAVDQKIVSRLKEISQTNGNLIYFGSSFPSQLLPVSQSYEYSIDNRLERKIIKYSVYEKN